MPCYLEYVAAELSGCSDVNVGGVMGFPYGMDYTDIKAGGGIRSEEQMNAFIEAGANRFGIGLQSAINILENNKEVLSDY